MILSHVQRIERMKLIKLYLCILIVTFLILFGLDGCYVQFGATSDEQSSTDDSPPIDDQPFIEAYPLPNIPPDRNPEYPHHNPALPPAGHTKQPEPNPPPEPHRQTGIRQTTGSDQNESRQSGSTTTRTSWSPAPPPSTPPVNTSTPTRTTGSTRR